MKRWLLSIIILLIGIPAICRGDGACTTAMPFLSMGMGVRASAMAKAFCAVADDSSAVYWNPAGLGRIKSGQMSLEHTRWFEDIAYTDISSVFPLKTVTMGAFAGMLLSDEMQVTTNAKPGGTGQTFRKTDAIFGTSFGIDMGRHISAGATGKVLLQRIEDEDAAGFAGDLGFLCKTKHAGVGLVLQNMGTKMKFIDRGFVLPATIRAGLAWTYPWFTVSCDVANILPEKKTVVCAGFEGWIANVIALRGGYDSEEGHGLTAGFGTRLRDIQLDYAYVPYEKFEATHRLAASVKFGGRPDSGKAQKAADSGDISRIMEAAPLADESAKPTSIQETTNLQQADQTPAPEPTAQKQAAQTPVSVVSTGSATKSAPAVSTGSASTPPASLRTGTSPVSTAASPLKPSTASTTPKQAAQTPALTGSTGSAAKPAPAVLTGGVSAPPVSLRTGTSPVPTGQQPKQIRTVTITADNAPIFSGPGTTYAVITTVPAGVELILVDDSKRWYYQVKLPDGKHGWVSYVNCQK